MTPFSIFTDTCTGPTSAFPTLLTSEISAIRFSSEEVLKVLPVVSENCGESGHVVFQVQEEGDEVGSRHRRN